MRRSFILLILDTCIDIYYFADKERDLQGDFYFYDPEGGTWRIFIVTMIKNDQKPNFVVYGQIWLIFKLNYP